MRKKEELELMVERMSDPDDEIVKAALDLVCNEIKTSTSSMTAVPKPLKFLRLHRGKMIEIHNSMKSKTNKVCFFGKIFISSFNSNRSCLPILYRC